MEIDDVGGWKISLISQTSTKADVLGLDTQYKHRMHIFSDAVKSAYSSASYLVLVN